MTRLVKLLYLADVEYFRTYGKRLTDLRWRFLHFGPYASELVDVLGKPEVEEIPLHDRKQPKQFVFNEMELDRAEVPREVAQIVDGLVKEWGDADLNQLLDYVYFETEPMQDVERGSFLDFSKISRENLVSQRLHLDDNKLAELRKNLKKATESNRESRFVPRASAELREALSAWDEDFKIGLPSGTCRIDIDDLRGRKSE